MNIIEYVLINLKRKPIQTIVIIISLSLTLLSGLLLTKFLLISNERFKTLAREGQAIIAPKSDSIDTLLSVLNLEVKSLDFIPENLYNTIALQTPKAFEDGQKVYTQINQAIPFLQFGLIQNKFLVMGTNQNFFNRSYYSDQIKITAGRWVNNENEIVIGKNLNYKLDQNIEVMIGSNNYIKKYIVVGIIDANGRAWDNGAYTNIQTAQSALKDAGLLQTSIWKSNVLTSILIYVEPIHYQSLKSLINDRTVSLLISVPETINRLEDLTMSGSRITTLLVMLVTILGFCAIFGVIITRSEHMMNSLAILHSIGFSKYKIFALTLVENTLLWLFSSMIAMLFYSLLFIWMKNNFPLFRALNIELFNPELFYVIFFLGLSIFLLSLIPTWLLKKMGIHNILRSQ